MLEPVLTNPWVRAILVLLALSIIGLTAYLLSPVLVPLFVAFFVAYLLDPLVDRFEARGISRSMGIFCLATLGLLIVLAIPFLLVPGIVKQADELSKAAIELPNLPSARWFDAGTLFKAARKLPLQRVVETLGWEPTPQELAELAAPPPPEDTASEESSAPQVTEDITLVPSPPEGEPVQGETPTEDLKPSLPYDPLAVLARGMAERVREPAIQFLKTNAAQFFSFGEMAGAGLAQFLSAIGGAIVGAILAIANILLFAFVAAYLLKDYDFIIAKGKELIPTPYRKKTVEILGKIDGQLRAFLRGQIVVCLCLGAMYSIGLLISGVPFWLLIGVFGAVASFIPYLGLILTLGPAFILCVIQHGAIADWHVFGVAATFGIAQLLEGTVLTPKIVGDQVGLGPVWVILAILVFGNALGFLGLLVAVPVAACLKVLVVEGVDFYKNSEFYTGGAGKT